MTTEKTAGTTAGVIAPPPLIYLGGLISGMLLHLAYPTKLFSNPLCGTSETFEGGSDERQTKRRKDK